MNKYLRLTVSFTTDDEKQIVPDISLSATSLLMLDRRISDTFHIKSWNVRILEVYACFVDNGNDAANRVSIITAATNTAPSKNTVHKNSLLVGVMKNYTPVYYSPRTAIELYQTVV